MAKLPIVVNEAGLYETTLDGHVYEFAKWRAGDSLETLLDLSGVVGKPLTNTMAKGLVAYVSTQEHVEKMDVGEDAIAALLDEIINSLVSNKPQVLSIIKRLATKDVICDGKAGPIVFDTHYRDRLPHLLFGVCRAALEVQYGNFFVALGGMFNIRPKEPGKMPAPPATPTA